MIGIDEVGRGCWAGPLLVVAARQITQLPEGLGDSKLISKPKREQLYEEIKASCQLGEGWVHPEEIDEHGLTAAMRMGVCRALLSLGASLDDDIVMDGHINYCPTDYTQVRTVVKADSAFPVVSAASIYAKVTRDRYMERIAKFHPFYGFEQHVGYGTALHRSALKIHGVSSVHRKSYKPIQAFL